jgi:hypothetical protein
LCHRKIAVDELAIHKSIVRKIAVREIAILENAILKLPMVDLLVDINDFFECFMGVNQVFH